MVIVTIGSITTTAATAAAAVASCRETCQLARCRYCSCSPACPRPFVWPLHPSSVVTVAASLVVTCMPTASMVVASACLAVASACLVATCLGTAATSACLVVAFASPVAQS